MLRKWIAFGTGVGVEIGPEHLTVSVVRVRPSGGRLLGSGVVENFRQRPAAEWGREYGEIVKRHGAAHVAAAVLIPRGEVIVRTLPFPGVKAEELGTAVGYQLDALHPYGEDEARAGWARIDETNVLIGVAKRQLVEQYLALFAEAGVKVSTLTFSAAALRGALRMVSSPPGNFLAGMQTAEGVEIYGESEARPVYSAVFDIDPERVLALANAELRLPADTQPSDLAFSLSHAAAMASACPSLAVDANLLPEADRRTSSKLRYVPTAVLGTVLAGLCAAILLHEPYDEKVYREALVAELKRVEPLSSRAGGLEKNLDTTKKRIDQLDEFRQRTRADLDLILELTSTFAAPAYLSGLDTTRETVTMTGYTDQAAPMLRVLDGSPRLAGSEFTVPIGRTSAGESFRIRSQRETLKP